MDKYLGFHRKYRAANLHSYRGNTAMIRKLLAALEVDASRPQVMLFSGHAGCGKTTAGRLVIKEYLCENRSAVTGACGECQSCKNVEHYIETGDFSYLQGVIEVDAADNNKRQDLDSVLDEADTPSYDGGWKIFLLDECHMLSVGAQNRLLKTLEEPAEHVLIILCTTEPQKLLTTILSRCQYPFRVTKPNREELCSLLAEVCRKEGLEYDSKGLSAICVRSDFVPRQALILLEQVSKEYKDVKYENVIQALDIMADAEFFEFLSIISEKPLDTLKYISFLAKMRQTADLSVFINSLIEFFVRGLYVHNNAFVEALDASEITRFKELFRRFSVAEVAFLLKTFMSIKNSSDIETKLMVLGYEGLNPANTVAQTELKVIKDNNLSATAEKNFGDKVHQDSLIMTQEEINKITSEPLKQASIEDLASTFKIVKVTGGIGVANLPFMNSDVKE